MEAIRHINIPIFVPHKGCPHTCVFCDQRKISGTIKAQSMEKVKEIIEESLSSIEDNAAVEIAFFGGSFTGIPEPEMLSYLNTARPYLESGKVQGIRLSTRPDTITSSIIDILRQYGVTSIELGVQSLDEEVLRLSQRGHSVNAVVSACKLVKESGIKLGIQTMLGLPGDDFYKTLQTAYGVLELEPDMVRIYPVLVLKGTYLEEMYLDGAYKPLSLEEAVRWCESVLPLYRKANITVLRMGLQDTETLGSSVVAGPYHPAFGELVESRILLSKLEEEMDRLAVFGKDKVLIRTKKELVSKLVGQKRSNIKALQNKYSIKEIKVKADLTEETFQIQLMD